MKSVTQLPNGVLCISDARNALPPETCVFGPASEYYDEEGNILPEYQDLPKFKPSLLEKPDEQP